MNSRYLFIISFAIQMVLSATASADTPPPITTYGFPSSKDRLKEKQTDGMTMGSLRVKFEKTTLDEIRLAASAGEVSHQGDAGDSIYWLCYTNQNAKQSERIWVISHGEMGGREHAVTQINAQILLNGKASTDCPALRTNLLPLTLDNGLWLNSTLQDVQKMGATSFHKEPWRSYYYESKVPSECEGEGSDLLNWLALKIVKGRVVTIHAGQVTSC